MRGLINAGIESQGPSFPWEIWNRGKRSIALDLRQDRAREIVLGLAEQADVFLTSYLPATRAKLGLDIADVQARNPERSEEHTSELQSLMRISYAVFCLKNKKTK